MPHVAVNALLNPHGNRYLDLSEASVASLALDDLVADDLALNGHAQTGEGAIAKRSRHQGLAALGLGQLEGVSLTTIQAAHGDQPYVTVPARDDSHQLLKLQQVHMVHLLVVAHTGDL